MAKQTTPELTYTEAMIQIEEILTKFRSQEMSVDTLVSEVQRATELIDTCKAQLLKAETDVKKILE